MTYSLGIDLGTTFTAAAVYEQGRASTTDLADGRKTLDQFSPASAPPGATQICAVVADASHAVDAPEWVSDTVSCVDLV